MMPAMLQRERPMLRRGEDAPDPLAAVRERVVAGAPALAADVDVLEFRLEAGQWPRLHWVSAAKVKPGATLVGPGGEFDVGDVVVVESMPVTVVETIGWAVQGTVRAAGGDQAPMASTSRGTPMTTEAPGVASVSTYQRWPMHDGRAVSADELGAEVRQAADRVLATPRTASGRAVVNRYLLPGVRQAVVVYEAPQREVFTRWAWRRPLVQSTRERVLIGGEEAWIERPRVVGTEDEVSYSAVLVGGVDLPAPPVPWEPGRATAEEVIAWGAGYAAGLAAGAGGAVLADDERRRR